MENLQFKDEVNTGFISVKFLRYSEKVKFRLKGSTITNFFIRRFVLKSKKVYRVVLLCYHTPSLYFLPFFKNVRECKCLIDKGSEGTKNNNNSKTKQKLCPRIVQRIRPDVQ